MSIKSLMVGFRATDDDRIMFEQAAAQNGLKRAAWMREGLRKLALQQVYGKGVQRPFPSSPAEEAIFRAVLIILQTVSLDTPDETRNIFTEKATREIQKFKDQNGQ